MIDYKKYLNPEFIARLKGMHLKARLVVEGFLEGLHRSPFKGSSVEFAEYRPYIPGDNPKQIDWRVYGRTDRLYVKEYQEETNLRAYILLDSSGSMNYSSDKITKFEYASYLAGALIYLLIKQKDSVGLAYFDTEIRDFLPPRSSFPHMHLLFKKISEIKPGRETSISTALSQLAQKIKRRGLIILISDCFDFPEPFLETLRGLRYKKNELIVFQILDPQEIEFNFNLPLEMKDMETKKRMVVDPQKLRKEYREILDEFIQKISKGCKEHEIEHHLITTSQPLDKALFSYLGKRRRLT